jgi:hypothetical protein
VVPEGVGGARRLLFPRCCPRLFGCFHLRSDLLQELLAALLPKDAAAAKEDMANEAAAVRLDSSTRFANASISAWTKAAQHRDVAEVQGDGVEADQHLAPLQPRIVFLLQAKIIQAQ